ncbi:MAG: hypothetical protein KBI46_00085 [Phycisphaerae bacterium]|nr:hypothetical protein [Phycisphaerae bacterium]
MSRIRKPCTGFDNSVFAALFSFKMSKICAVLAVSMIGAAFAADGWPSGREKIEFKAEPFSLQDVRLTEGPFRDAMLRTQHYLHDLESDSLLEPLNVPREMIYTKNNWFEFPQEEIADSPILVTDGRKPHEWIKPVEGRTLELGTENVGRPSDVELIPYYRLWNCKYAVYWQLTDQDGWEKLQLQLQAQRQARAEQAARRAARQAALKARTIDAVQIGQPDSETAHEMKSAESRTGENNGRTWRDAGPGGWFEYRLKVLPELPMTLLCTYWGGDSGRIFDILVDGQVIAVQRLDRPKPGEFLEVEYEIPDNLVKNKSSVVIRFDGHNGSITGGLYGCAVLKPSEQLDK